MKIKDKKEKKALTNMTGLLIAMLLRYPEVNRLSLDIQNKRLQFTFMILNQKTEGFFAAMAARLKEALNAYYKLNKVKINFFDIDVIGDNTYWQFALIRDWDTFSVKELQFVIDFLLQEDVGALAGVEGDSFAGNYIGDESIESFWQKAQKKKTYSKIIAYRENGQVLVYNQK